MKKETIMKAKKISLIMMLLIIIVAIIHITISVILTYNNAVTSFPWWSAIVLVGIYYVPILILSIVVFIIFLVKSKR